MSAIGVNAIAASAEETTVDMHSPRAVAFIASATRFPSSKRKAIGPPLNPSAKKTMPRSIEHWSTQKKLSSRYFDST